MQDLSQHEEISADGNVQSHIGERRVMVTSMESGTHGARLHATVLLNRSEKSQQDYLIARVRACVR